MFRQLSGLFWFWRKLKNAMFLRQVLYLWGASSFFDFWADLRMLILDGHQILTSSERESRTKFTNVCIASLFSDLRPKRSQMFDPPVPLRSSPCWKNLQTSTKTCLVCCAVFFPAGVGQWLYWQKWNVKVIIIFSRVYHPLKIRVNVFSGL